LDHPKGQRKSRPQIEKKLDDAVEKENEGSEKPKKKRAEVASPGGNTEQGTTKRRVEITRSDETKQLGKEGRKNEGVRTKGGKGTREGGLSSQELKPTRDAKGGKKGMRANYIQSPKLGTSKKGSKRGKEGRTSQHAVRRNQGEKREERREQAAPQKAR